jgi:Rrf2 family nitric oxide-sensitive transcriptional repressor
MHLTKFSDYALRVLMIAAAKGEARLTIEDTAEIFGISHGHLKKVVLKLTRAGYLRGIKGRTGIFWPVSLMRSTWARCCG